MLLMDMFESSFTDIITQHSKMNFHRMIGSTHRQSHYFGLNHKNCEDKNFLANQYNTVAKAISMQ